jgi:hypothetical protein
MGAPFAKFVGQVQYLAEAEAAAAASATVRNGARPVLPGAETLTLDPAIG